MFYWNNKKERAEKARKHTEQMQREHGDEIAASIRNTVTYGGADKIPIGSWSTNTPVVKVLQTDSVSALFAEQEGKTAVLNFASYKNPGGMFLNGSSAQEESLCHESTLYNILSTFEDTYYAYNRKHTNRAMYTNRALYTPDVYFETAPGDFAYYDVITCAAPNFGAAQKYQNVSKEENTKILRSRVQFVKDIAEENAVTTLVLGAFGCGVFKQDTAEVAQMMKEIFEETAVKKIVHSVPDDKNFYIFWKCFR